jgi:hypothetical protein
LVLGVFPFLIPEWLEQDMAAAAPETQTTTPLPVQVQVEL